MIPKRKIQQLKTGVHLVAITDATLGDTFDDGITQLRIRFSDGTNNHYEQDYFIGAQVLHGYFVKMCAAAKINMEAPGFKKEAIGKRCWICIKEVYLISNDELVKGEDSKPQIDYLLFDVLPWLDSLAKPKLKGDPADNEGVASGVFLDYKPIDLANDFDKVYGEIKSVALEETNKEIFNDLLIQGKAVVKITPEEPFAERIDPKKPLPATEEETIKVIEKFIELPPTEESDWDNF